MTLLAASAALRGVHEVGAWAVVLANGAAGSWALGAHRWSTLRHRSLWWFTAVAQVAIFAQVAVGVAMVQGEPVEQIRFHMFYGFVALFAVAIIYSYRAQLRPHLYLLYGLGGLFVTGLCIRAMTLDPV